MKILKKVAKDKKGISPVLAVLLMIAVAVAAALVTYAWVMGYLGTTTSRAGRAIQIQSIAFDIGAGSWGDGDESITVYVQNVGQGSVDISNVYVDDDLVTATGTGVKAEGETAVLTIGSQTLALGADVQIKVTCVDGTFTEASGLVE